jgi:hypothetical protein
MMDIITSTHTTRNTCVNCRHVYAGKPVRCYWSDLPQVAYRCTLTGRKVNPNQTPCSLYKSLPLPVCPPPTRPNTHPPTP